MTERQGLNSSTFLTEVGFADDIEENDSCELNESKASRAEKFIEKSIIELHPKESFFESISLIPIHKAKPKLPQDHTLISKINYEDIPVEFAYSISFFFFFSIYIVQSTEGELEMEME